jgi:hypothetical protein
MFRGEGLESFSDGVASPGVFPNLWDDKFKLISKTV